MKKIFCDVCSTEIKEKNKIPEGDLVTGVAMKNRKEHIEVRLYISGLPKHVDCCKHCLIDSVTKMDDRPTLEYEATS